MYFKRPGYLFLCSKISWKIIFLSSRNWIEVLIPREATHKDEAMDPSVNITEMWISLSLFTFSCCEQQFYKLTDLKQHTFITSSLSGPGVLVWATWGLCSARAMVSSEAHLWKDLLPSSCGCIGIHFHQTRDLGCSLIVSLKLSSVFWQTSLPNVVTCFLKSGKEENLLAKWTLLSYVMSSQRWYTQTLPYFIG